MDNPEEPATPNCDCGYAEWVQIVLILLRVELDNSHRESQTWFNNATVILLELGLNKTPQSLSEKQL